MNFRALPTNVEAFFSSLMVGLAESYFIAAALETGVAPISAGLLIPISMVLGALLSLICSEVMPQRRSKNVVLLAGIGQALALLLLLLLVYFKIRTELGFLGVSTIYYFFGFMVMPFWNLWIGELIPVARTTAFFNLRLQFSHLGLLAGLIGGGLFLNSLWFAVSRTEAFSILFILAFISRLISVKSLSFLEAVESSPQLNIRAAIRLFFHDLEYRNFFGFMFFFYLTVAISSPFVSPFLLTDLKFNYTQYMGILAAFLLGKYSFFPVGSRLLDRFGVHNLIRIGALGIAPLPFLWFWSRSFPAAFFLQFVSGIFWAFFEMGFSVLFFKHLEKREKIAILSLYNFFNTLAVAIGGLFGAWLIQFGGETSYYRAFFGGAILRLLLVLIVPIRFQPERRAVPHCIA